MTAPPRAVHRSAGMPRSFAPAPMRAMRPAAPARLNAGKVIHTDQLPPVTMYPHRGSESTWTSRTWRQSASSSSARMRASAVPICCPISARMMLMVTMPSRSMLYQIVGSKVLGAAGAAPFAHESVRSKPNMSAAPVIPMRKRRRDGTCLGLSIRVRSKLCRGPLNGFANAQVGHAAAEVPGHDAIDVLVAGRWKVLQQGRRLHDLAGLAVAALRHLEVDPGFL